MKKNFMLGLALAVILATVVSTAALASGIPTITSDLHDYMPGDTVTLSGAGWTAGESVHIFVNDTVGNTWSLDSNPDPIAASDGTFMFAFQLPSWFVSDYNVTATGS